MNAIQLKSAFVILLALSLLKLTLAYAAPPTKVTVTAASPNSALQGEALNVVISGSGFGHGSTVKYLVSGTNDDSQIAVSSVTYNEVDDTLTTTIQVGESAVISDYDIEVQPLSGRRGKGTTLFSVQAKDNNGGGQNDLLSITCDELFGFSEGTCTAEGTTDACMFYQPIDNDRAWQMLQHCDTHAMLIVPPEFPFIHGGGFRLNLVAPWSGDSAGITNSQGANRIDNFHIVVKGSVAEGCGAAGKVQAAVSFDPDLEPRSGMPRGSVGNITVETQGGALLCNGIEYVGSDPYIGNPYKSVQVTSSYIMADSYEAIGIWMANINMSDLNDQVKNEFAFVAHNIVEASNSPCAVGVLVGPNVERPIVENNLVHASGSTGCPGSDRTVGIALLDSGRDVDSPLGSAYDFLTARSTELSANAVQTGGSGSIGILVVGATDAESTKDQVTAGDGADFAVCVETGANFTEVKKGSDYFGFNAGNGVVFTADCGAALP